MNDGARCRAGGGWRRVASSHAACALIALAAVGLGGCAGLPAGDGPHEVALSADRVAQILGGRLGGERKVLDLFDVSFGAPKVAFDESSGRLRASFDVSIRHPFSQKPFTGKAALSGGLAFDQQSMTVNLLEPRIETLDIDGVPAQFRDSVGRIGNALGASYLRQYPLLALKPEDLRAGGRDYTVKGIEVVRDALKVVLVPKIP